MKIDITQIDSIIFDLGGVILNLDYQKTIDAFTALGLNKSGQLFSQSHQTTLFNNFETGKISAVQFRSGIRKLVSSELSDSQIDDAWNSMLFDLPLKRIELLKDIAKSKRIFLLSNTNEIHMDWFKSYTNELLGKDVFFKLFEVAYLSNEMGLRKPNADIFEYVTNENNLNPTKTLFIDDSKQHIIGAKKVGLNAYHILPEEDILRLFDGF